MDCDEAFWRVKETADGCSVHELIGTVLEKD